MAFISEDEAKANPLSARPGDEGVASDELDATLAAIRRLIQDPQPVVVLRTNPVSGDIRPGYSGHMSPETAGVVLGRFSTDMSHPRFAVALHRALADVWEELS